MLDWILVQAPVVQKLDSAIHRDKSLSSAGADPGFFLGGGALVSCSTSTPVNHVFFLQNTSCIRKPQVISEGRGAHPLHPPPRSAPAADKYQGKQLCYLLDSSLCTAAPPLFFLGDGATVHRLLDSDLSGE